MKANFNWPFPQTHITLEHPLTEVYARWCFSNFSPSANEILRETIWIFYIKHNSWLNPAIAQIFGYHIEQMHSRLVHAIATGKLKAQYPAKFTIDHACVIGAVLCELIHKGDLSGSHLWKVTSTTEHIKLTA